MSRHLPVLPVRSSRRAFTLVELLVVITIIAMLVGLLIPAVMAARNAARKTQCMNNVKQLTTGVMNYVTSKEKFPPAFSNQPDPGGVLGATPQAVGWVPPILPYIEQNEYYRLFQSNQLNLQQRLEVETLVCPSRAPSNSPAPLCYVVNGGATDAVQANQPMDFIENAVFFDEFLPRHSVPAANRPRPTAPIDLAYMASHDGSGKTIMLAENNDARDWYNIPGATPPAMVPPQPSLTGTTPGESWWNSIIWIQTANPAPDWGTKTDATTNALLGRPAPLGSTPNDMQNGRPYSDHSGGFHVAFCGGTVQFMSNDVEYRVYALLMSPDSSNAKNTVVTPIGDPYVYPANWHQQQNVANPLVPLSETDMNP